MTSTLTSLPSVRVSDDENPRSVAGEAALFGGLGRRSAADKGLEAGRAPGGALLIWATTMLSFSASLAGQNGTSGSKFGIGPSGSS